LLKLGGTSYQQTAAVRIFDLFSQWKCP